MNSYEKPLPHSPDTERALLGGIILGGEWPSLDASEFHLPFHQSLFQSLTRLRAAGKPTDDLVLLADTLSPTELDDSGGIAYIASLTDGLPKTKNLSHYVTIIKQHAQARRALTTCDLMVRKIESSNGNLPDVLREISSYAATLSSNLREGNSLHSPALRAVSVTELLRLDVKEREMVLTPFLPTQGLGMLYSKRGVGKTFISLGIAVAVASGTSFLKWSAPKPRRVLYVDGEMPLSALQKRVLDIASGAGIAHPLDNLHFITPDLQPHALPDLATPAGQSLIEAHLEGVELLVLDNLSCLVRESRENEGDDWVQIQGWALDLRRRGISVLFVHHAGKSGSQRGSSRREDLLDSVVTLRHPSDYNPSEALRCEVHYEKSRGFFGEDARPFEVKLLAGPSGESVWTTSDPEASIEDRVLEMHNKLEMSYREIAEELGVGKSTVQRIIKRRLSHCPTPKE